MGSLLQSFEDLISAFENQLFGSCIAQRSHKVCVFFCTFVVLLAAFLKIYALDLFSFLNVAEIL